MSSNSVPGFEVRISPNEASPEARRLLVVVIASAVIIAPALIYGVPSNIDLFNHFRFALPFYDALHNGTLPGWLNRILVTATPVLDSILRLSITCLLLPE